VTPGRGQLRQLLDPWKTPSLEHPGGFRFHDAPPDVVRRALAAVDPVFRSSRPNGQPPADWLVDVAERLGGLLAGQVGDDEGLPERLRIDALCVPGERGADLARAVDRDWPDVVHGDVALDLSLAEAWERWDAVEPVWTGSGRELLDGLPRAAVVGLWWD
jgi:hypothetical protein